MPGLAEYLQCGIACIISAIEAATAHPENFFSILVEEITCIFGCAQTWLM